MRKTNKELEIEFFQKNKHPISKIYIYNEDSRFLSGAEIERFLKENDANLSDLELEAQEQGEPYTNATRLVILMSLEKKNPNYEKEMQEYQLSLKKYVEEQQALEEEKLNLQ